MSEVGVTINVRGVVQGVGFRYWCYRKARELALRGYVANLYDGSVEVVAEGEKGIIEEFLKLLKIGPTYAQITDIKILRHEKLKGFKDFTIEYKD
ncbi:MAG: acylphosphatase [candidate division Zixibacteria bacterium]|nr:acylphosphatase [candidate division Zixibacteria bacterium]